MLLEIICLGCFIIPQSEGHPNHETVCHVELRTEGFLVEAEYLHEGPDGKLYRSSQRFERQILTIAAQGQPWRVPPTLTINGKVISLCTYYPTGETPLEIFDDNFESGDTKNWSKAVP